MTALTTHQLTVSRGTKCLIRDLSLTMLPGECWGILGPNGSGKTTLLHTLCGHLPPLSGHIMLNDLPLAAHSARMVAQQLGILFQQSQYLFPQTVNDYCLDARFPHRSLFDTRVTVNDAELLQNTLQDLDLANLASTNIQHLSGGEQRRAAIAALLIQAPAIYMLDEPANHLDLRHQIKIMNIFAQLCAKGHTIVMNMHDINLTARYCDKIVMIFPNGSTLHGDRTTILSKENLSRLYQHPIDVIHNGDQTHLIYTY